MEQITRAIAFAILSTVFGLSGVQFYQGAALTYIFLLAVALAGSGIPAGLPVPITVAISTALFT